MSWISYISVSKVDKFNVCSVISVLDVDCSVLLFVFNSVHLIMLCKLLLQEVKLYRTTREREQ